MIDGTQIVKCLGKSWIEGDGIFNAIGGPPKLPAFFRNKSQVVPDDRIVWLRSKNATIELFSFIQPRLFMKLNGEREYFRGAVHVVMR